MPFSSSHTSHRPVSRHGGRGDVVLVSSACSFFLSSDENVVCPSVPAFPCLVVLFFPIASSPSHSVISFVSSCVPFCSTLSCARLSSLKRRVWIIHPCPAPPHPSHRLIISSCHLVISSSHPINRPVLLPVHRHDRRGVFFCLSFCGLCGSVALAAYRAAVPPCRLARLVAIALGPVCFANRLGSLVYRACPCLVIVP